jgi:hypothetical protein
MLPLISDLKAIKGHIQMNSIKTPMAKFITAPFALFLLLHHKFKAL